MTKETTREVTREATREVTKEATTKVTREANRQVTREIIPVRLYQRGVCCILRSCASTSLERGNKLLGKDLVLQTHLTVSEVG